MATKSKSDISVVVVESHHHVLEHIHLVLRRQNFGLTETCLKEGGQRTINKIQPPPWRMLHFDAHPDLACPNCNIPAGACFRPRQLWPSKNSDKEDSKDLYDMLETTTGIAEWILVLVLAGGLAQVEWVKPRLPTNQRSQLPLGRHLYRVGAWWKIYNENETAGSPRSFLDLPESAQVKVDWNCRYYREDEEDGYAPTEELRLSQELALNVAMVTDAVDSSVDNGLPWVLDVCLDYFVCVNPFYADIEAISAEFAAALVDLTIQSRIYHEEDGNNSHDHQSFMAFRRAVLSLLHSIKARQVTDVDFEKTVTLLPFYDSFEVMESLTAALIRTTHDLPLDSVEELCKLGEEAVMFLHLPHFPERGKDKQHIQSALDGLEQSLARARTAPFMVTLARSCSDGFTPDYVVEELQEQVLNRIHICFCSCNRRVRSPKDLGNEQCRFNIVFDYGKWEGSTIQFHTIPLS